MTGVVKSEDILKMARNEIANLTGRENGQRHRVVPKSFSGKRARTAKPQLTIFIKQALIYSSCWIISRDDEVFLRN